MEFEKYSKSFLHFYTNEVPPPVRKHLASRERYALADLGCGDGALLVALKNAGYLSKADRVLAVDLSEERLERLKAEDFETLRSDVTSLPGEKDGAFDFIINTQVIEHLPDEQKFLAEVKRLLKPGGTLYIASLAKKWYGWFYYRTREGKWGIDPTHMREYPSLERFEEIVRDAGLEVIDRRSTALRLSIVEFLMRRLVVPFFSPRDPNGVFMRRPLLNFIRRHFNLCPPGYSIIEVVARKPAATPGSN